MPVGYIALGGNLGPVLETFAMAVRSLASDGLTISRVSPAYRSTAWTQEPHEEQPDYWNAVCEIQTSLEPLHVLGELQRVERICGRERTVRWAPRKLDLDLLLLGGTEFRHPDLTVPHPGLLQRPFVIWPLAVLAPDLAVPPTGVRVREAKTQLARTAGAEEVGEVETRLGLLEIREGWAGLPPASAPGK